MYELFNNAELICGSWSYLWFSLCSECGKEAI